MPTQVCSYRDTNEEIMQYCEEIPDAGVVTEETYHSALNRVAWTRWCMCLPLHIPIGLFSDMCSECSVTSAWLIDSSNLLNERHLTQHESGSWQSTWYTHAVAIAMQSSTFSAIPACETEPEKSSKSDNGEGTIYVYNAIKDSFEYQDYIEHRAFIAFNLNLTPALISCVCWENV